MPTGRRGAGSGRVGRSPVQGRSVRRVSRTSDNGQMSATGTTSTAVPAVLPERIRGLLPSSRVGIRLLAVVIVALAALPVVLRYLVFWPLDQWQVDVEVYRQAGESILVGRPVYSAMTEPPQLLPFTYPPFAAILAVPLALVPFGVAGWLWTAAQVAATTTIVWYAAYRLIHRFGPWAPIACAVLAAPMLWLHPVSDGIRFGQVNAFIVLACLMDLRRPRPRVIAWLPAGVLVGLAMSIKLTPGVFVVHYLVNRRWREAATAVGTAVGVTLLSWVVLPGASFAFWGGALQDPSRLGPNRGTSNQSIRGVLLRFVGEGAAASVLWILLAGAVIGLGFGLARRFWLAGDSIAEVATVGLIAFLISPVSWIHHLHWIVVVIFAILGADPLRERARLWAGLAVAGWVLGRFVWWGVSLIASGQPWVPLGRLLQNSDTILAAVALVLLARLALPRGADYRVTR